MNLIWKLLIAIGIGIVFYAITMDVALEGSNTVNMHLLSNRQNYTILGAMLFISGIILFATTKVKSRSEDIDNIDAHAQRTKEGIIVAAKVIPSFVDMLINILKEVFPEMLNIIKNNRKIFYTLAVIILCLSFIPIFQNIKSSSHHKPFSIDQARDSGWSYLDNYTTKYAYLVSPNRTNDGSYILEVSYKNVDNFNLMEHEMREVDCTKMRCRYLPEELFYNKGEWKNFDSLVNDAIKDILHNVCK